MVQSSRDRRSLPLNFHCVGQVSTNNSTGVEGSCMGGGGGGEVVWGGSGENNRLPSHCIPPLKFELRAELKI